MGTNLRWRRSLRRQLPIATVVTTEAVGDPAYRAAGERLRILPTLPKNRFDVGHRRPSDSELNVVPRRGLPVFRSHRLALRIPSVRRVVTAAVAEIDAPEERDIQFGPAAVAQHHELLVVRSAGTHPHVE